MAEKEERICITKLGPNPSDCFLIDNTCDGMCVRCTQGITRQEAINRMAKAICKFEMMTVRHICKDCSEECFDHLELEVVDKAEAALNALLSEEEYHKKLRLQVGKTYIAKDGAEVSIIYQSPIRSTGYLGIRATDYKTHPDDAIWYNPDGSHNEKYDCLTIVKEKEKTK